MSLTQREAFARLMEHMCRHDGDGGHGYSQVNRMGDGTVEWVDLGDGNLEPHIGLQIPVRPRPMRGVPYWDFRHVSK